MPNPTTMPPDGQQRPEPLVPAHVDLRDIPFPLHPALVSDWCESHGITDPEAIDWMTLYAADVIDQIDAIRWRAGRPE